MEENRESLEYDSESEDLDMLTQEVVENIFENTFKNDSEEENEEPMISVEGTDNEYELKQEAIESLLDFLENTLENDSKEEDEEPVTSVEPIASVDEPSVSVGEPTATADNAVIELNIIIDKELLKELPLGRDVVFEPYETAHPLTTVDRIKRWWCDLFPSGTFA
jgi:hypothetical protein